MGSITFKGKKFFGKDLEIRFKNLLLDGKVIAEGEQSILELKVEGDVSIVNSTASV